VIDTYDYKIGTLRRPLIFFGWPQNRHASVSRRFVDHLAQALPATRDPRTAERSGFAPMNKYRPEATKTL
jgi:hypothetical protein